MRFGLGGGFRNGVKAKGGGMGVCGDMNWEMTLPCYINPQTLHLNPKSVS